jgi:hypothetical protein
LGGFISVRSALEEELLIINQNEIVSSNGLIEKEKGFTQLLNTYSKVTFNEEHLETAENVPGDGSCLYHAILHSFERKYGKNWKKIIKK